jgi:imidazolonepropionase-like amidohydrolase
MTLRAIVGATTIDGTGRASIPDSVIVMDDGRLAFVGRRADADLSAVKETLDAKGRFVIPGLIDANVHLVAAITPDLVLEFDGRFEELVLEAAQVTLRAGVTTVFDTWGPVGPLTEVRDRIARGAAVGSRLFAAGNIIGFDGPLSEDFTSMRGVYGIDTIRRINDQWTAGAGSELLWLTPDEVRARVRAYLERTGVDFLKYGASGHIQMQFIAFSECVQRAIVEEGHRAGVTVQAHTTSVESLRMAIEAGVDILQHGNATGLAPMPEGTLQTIVSRQQPVAALFYTDEYMAWSDANAAPIFRSFINEHLDLNNRRLIEAGANVLLATDGFAYGARNRSHPLATRLRDAPDLPVQLGISHRMWVKAAIERGMSAMDALLAATIRPARAYQRHDIGSLEPGKRADLVILDGDPLTDTENYSRVHAVIKDGLDVDREALPESSVLLA